MHLPYTLCFCIQGESVLMLYRYNPPNERLWNGLGGKIESHERPTASARRELFEEAGIVLSEEISLYFAGIVTWRHEERNKPISGMYTFIADFNSDAKLPERTIREGRLGWKSLAWVCDKNNPAVVENIPYFLTDMFDYNIPLHYHFDYANRQIQNYTRSHVPFNLAL